MKQFLSAARLIDSDSPEVMAFAHEAAAGADNELDRVLRIYHAVRDGITYDPYVDFTDPGNFRASGTLAARRGFCIGKAALFAACLRVVGTPARVGYADVKNHMTSARLYEWMKSDVFLWHSFAEVFFDGRWVKATPAFDLALTERLHLAPLDFDGRTDLLFHAFDRKGRRYMEYLSLRGSFADVPFEAIQADFRAAYPSLLGAKGLDGDFRTEAIAAD